MIKRANGQQQPLLELNPAGVFRSAASRYSIAAQETSR